MSEKDLAKHNNQKSLWCLIFSVIIVSFVAGYTTGFFVYNPQQQYAPPTSSVSQFKVEPKYHAPKLQVGPGSERFHDAVSSDAVDIDHDDQIIERMKR